MAETPNEETARIAKLCDEAHAVGFRDHALIACPKIDKLKVEVTAALRLASLASERANRAEARGAELAGLRRGNSLSQPGRQRSERFEAGGPVVFHRCP